MKSQSTYSPNPAGMGVIKRLQPVVNRHGSSQAIEPTFTPEPAFIPTYTPQPVEKPIIIQAPKPGDVIPATTANRDPFLSITGDKIIIGGWAIDKTTAYMAGGGIVGAALLVRLLR